MQDLWIKIQEWVAFIAAVVIFIVGR